MDLRRLSRVVTVLAVISLLCYPASVTAGDIVHDDDLAPKKPGCENDFVLVTIFCCSLLDPILVFVKSQLSCLIFFALLLTYL